jgi:hypothetical protein
VNRKLLKRIIVTVVLLVAMAPILSFAVDAFFWSQRADYGWSPNLKSVTFKSHHPIVVVDHAHGNASTSDFPGRYWPFGKLLRADGYDVKPYKGTFSREALDGIDVLVIANASGASKPQAFGINLPWLGDTERSRSDPAFTADEIASVRAWVQRGGSLLLIADHAPVGAASAGMAAAFGVRMFAGFVEVPGENSDPLIFSRANGRLGNHPILDGTTPDERVELVMTFTGQSLQGPDDAKIILRLPDSAIEYYPGENSGQYDSLDAGPAQGLAIEYGHGRVVVLGEAAMLTAQVSNREPFGMNLSANDNKQFALNVMHWLTDDRFEDSREPGLPNGSSRQ